MQRRTQGAVLAAVIVAVAACADPPTSPGSPHQARLTTEAFASRSGGRLVTMFDKCDPETFNAVLGDGTCVGKGNITFDEFIAELQSTQDVKAWRNVPGLVNTRAGEIIEVRNFGGEVHTFTPVANFGGGFIPDLNGLSGNPVPAPECLNFGAIVFVPAGGTQDVTVGSADAHYQCCIHPWMRTTVQVK